MTKFLTNKEIKWHLNNMKLKWIEFRCDFFVVKT